MGVHYRKTTTQAAGVWGIPPLYPLALPLLSLPLISGSCATNSDNWSYEKLLCPLIQRDRRTSRVLRNSLRWNPSIFYLPRSDLQDLGNDRGDPESHFLVTFELLIIFRGFGGSRRSAASQWT